jgi:transcriptional regulator with XRE-family HTH domain
LSIIKEKRSDFIMNNEKTGMLIAQIRKEKGLTQKQLADRIGVSNATISKWETAKGFPDISLIEY